MSAHNATIGQETLRDVVVAVGDHNLIRHMPLKSGLPLLPAGQLMSEDHNQELVPFDLAMTADLAVGDGAATTFEFDLGGPLLPGELTLTDGVETFSDDGYANITSDGAGSGKINYHEGKVSVTFAAAPTNGSAISVTYKRTLSGVLARDCPASAASAELICRGRVSRSELSVNGQPLTPANYRKLDRAGIFLAD